MSKREPAILFEDIQTALEKIQRYVAGFNEAAFLADEKTIDAVLRNLEILGEAVKQLPNEWKQQRPTIRWSQIAGPRNRIVHDYAGVDLELVWNILQTSIPELVSQIDRIE